MCKVEGCDKKYTDPSSLRKQTRTVHFGEFLQSQKYKKVKTPDALNFCKLEGCYKKYRDPRSLRKHTRNVHKGADMYMRHQLEAEGLFPYPVSLPFTVKQEVIDEYDPALNQPELYEDYSEQMDEDSFLEVEADEIFSDDNIYFVSSSIKPSPTGVYSQVVESPVQQKAKDQMMSSPLSSQELCQVVEKHNSSSSSQDDKDEEELDIGALNDKYKDVLSIIPIITCTPDTEHVKTCDSDSSSKESITSTDSGLDRGNSPLCPASDGKDFQCECAVVLSTLFGDGYKNKVLGLIDAQLIHKIRNMVQS